MMPRDKATIDRSRTGQLNVGLAIVERDCVDWYAEATKVFVEGTEIGDMIRSEVPVSSDGAGSPPEEPTPPLPSTP